jgi:hypothetical protein
MREPRSTASEPATERELKAEELRVRRLEVERALADARRPWWRQPDPLVVGILAGAVTLIGNIISENIKSAHELEIEQTKARYNLVLQAMATADKTAAANNIKFFIEAGLLEDKDGKIQKAARELKPVLPVAGGGGGAGGLATAPELAKSYGMSDALDGAGQTVGIIELGGGFNPDDLAKAAKELHITLPKVKTVSLLGATSKPGDPADGQVQSDVQIIGSVVPAAAITVYFAPSTMEGMAAAITRATKERVSVISIGWGMAESQLAAGQIKTVNAALQQAAMAGLTVVAASGDQGPTDGIRDGHLHVDFPASSPWVLAVGGTSRASKAGGGAVETGWQGQSQGDLTFGSGWGTSALFPRPAWQSALPVAAGKTGRAIPDVSANADPNHGYMVFIGGRPGAVGGTSLATPLWAAQVVKLNQALGFHVGFMNACLYQKAGPAGVLGRVATSGSISLWDAQTGWGVPDARLVDWARQHWASDCGGRG